MGQSPHPSLAPGAQRRHQPLATFAIDAQLRQIARSQLGLVTYEQATRAGVDKHALARRRSAGTLAEVFPRVMLLDPVPSTLAQRILGAGLAVPGAIITATSSAFLHGLPIPPSEDDVTTHRPVLSIDRSRIIRIPEIRTIRQSVPPTSRRWFATHVATPAATLVALPRYVSDPTLERCLDHAIAHQLLTVRALRNLIEALPTAGRTGRKVLLDLLHVRLDGIGHRSKLEQRVAKWLRESGLRGWKSNARIDVHNRNPIEVDFAWYTQRVVLEVSPFFTHGSKLTQERDAERRRLLVEAGWRVIEATDRDLENGRAFRRTIAALRLCLRE